jgi:hypothetical protein
VLSASAVSRGEHSVPRVFHYFANLLLQSWFIFDEQNGLAAPCSWPDVRRCPQMSGFRLNFPGIWTIRTGGVWEGSTSPGW